jgi:dTDP-4-amino-4,6-dideoxygalactose transaminase
VTESVKPAFPEPLLVGRPNMGDRSRLLARISTLLDRRSFTNHGPLVQEFEAALSAELAVAHCVVTCNATIALEIAARALGLAGEVIVPAYTFIATAHALRWQEITPVLADIDQETHNLDPAAVEALISPRTTGILATHLWGRPCDIEALAGIARRHRLRLMFDAAHAFGCSYRGQPLGRFGDCEVFSFHATKFLNSFEGGAVATNDDALADRIRRMRNFGFAGVDQVLDLGTNGKMPEICAAMGLTSLESLDQIIAINQRNYHAYQAGLAGLAGISLISYDPLERNNYQYVVLEVAPALSAISRDELVDQLHRHGVMARKYFWPGVHRMHPYIAEQPGASQRLQATEQVAGSVIVLPTGQQTSPSDIARICTIIRQAST